MRKSILLLLVSCLVATMLADNYKILQMNTPSVKIGRRDCKKGDVFSEESRIIWSKSKQAIKAQNLRTKEIRLFAEPAFKKTNSKSIKEYFIKTNHLSSRAIGLSELSEQLNETFYLLDTIFIESPIPLDNTINYYIRYQQNDSLVEKSIPSSDNQFMIVRSLFNDIDSSYQDDFNVSIILRSIDVAEDYLLTDSMMIVLLPLEI